MAKAAEGDIERDREEGGALRPDPLPEPELRGLARIRSDLREGGLPQTVLAALVAWAITLAPAAFARSSPRSVVVLALFALLSGLGGPLLMTTRPQLARHIGISLFLVLAVTAWLIASPAIQPARMDPMRAAIGAVAWGVFALSWNERWTSKRAVEVDPQAPSLQARATLPRLAVPIAAIGVASGLAYIALAWRVREVDRGLMAHAVALVCAVAVITASASVAIGRGRRQVGGSRRITPHALRALILLVALAIGGAVILSLR
jgi:hypothetical protein